MPLSPQCRDPYKLCPCVRTMYFRMIHELETTHQLPVTLIETLREQDRQEYYIRVGVSRTLHSMHLAQLPNRLALAFDLAPTEYLAERGWHPEGALWRAMGDVGESVGLEWGGRWRSFHDMPHYQLRSCVCV